GLIAYWSFDGSDMNWSASGAEVRDLSGNSYHGSAENITSANATAGRQGQGLSFNGSDEYVEVGSMTGEEFSKKITIQSSEVDESLTDFPVYVDLSTLGSDFFSETNSGCADVRVTESDGSTEVPREIVSCDRTAETGEMHFKAPSLFASSDTEFYIYYGYGGSDYTDSDTYGAENVWTNGYAGVWHLGEGSDSAEDSTSNSYDGAFNGDLPSQITGQIGSAQDFDGSGDMVEIAGDVAGGLSALTISAWLKADITGLDMGVCGNDPSGDGDRQTGFGYDESGYESGNSNGFKGGIYYKDIGPESSSDMQTTDWQLVHYWWDGGYPEFYFDGSLDTDSYPINSINGTTDTPTNWYIGSGRKDDWAGFIDEVRISSSARSSGWIATEYNNQNSPGTFYNVGSEESTSNDPIKTKTISFWIKADDLTDRKIMDIDGTAHIEIDSSSNIIATDFPSPDVYVDGSDASAEITSDWHHVVITDSTGVEASAVDLARASNEYFDGTLDQVRFYDRVLSQDEIDKLYRHGARKLQPNTSQKGTQSDGLVGHWTFDGQDIDWSKTGAEVRDVSGQENHGSLEGGMGQHSVSIGKQGQALSFNGSDDHIAIDNSNSLDFGTGDFTYSLWVKSSQDCSGNKVYLGSYDQQESDPATWLGCNDSGYATFDVADSNNSGTSAIYNSSVVNDGEWHHIVGVKKGHSSASITTYFDADPSTVESSSFTGDFNYAGTNPHSIGRYEVSPYYYAEGSINDVRIYNKALSQDEIDKLYRHGARKLQPNTSQKGTQSDGLVGHWTFDGQDIDWSKTGAEVRDVSGQENHGSLEGGMGQHSVTIGKQGQALSFDGENDYVEINHAYSAFDNHDFTVSVWAKKETSDKVNEYRIVGSEDSGNEGNADIWWLLGTRDKNNGIGGQITAQFDDDVNKIFLQDINNASFVPQKGDWNFYTIKHVEGSGYYLYANGEQIFFSGEDNGSIVEGTHSFYIGIDGRDEGPWNGDIDDVRIYDRALSEEEIQKLYRKTGRKLQI
ncbi:MAG: LamG-like jellyroll fold domain-containing protein, partial [Candidatus Paceibacterota bacterium]